jgi:hypothetical protein
MTGRTHLPIPIALTTLAALLGTIAALVLSGGQSALAHDGRDHRATAPISPKELALRQDMRKLWEDHVTWTRIAVISLTGGMPDADAAVGRLLANQTDIGNAVKPFYGAAAGRQLTALLREHIVIAADLIGAAKKGDQRAVSTQQARWAANADEIAAFLSQANPRFWKLGAMKAMMRQHLGLTTSEVLARLQRNWEADVRAYDRVHVQILHMADMLSDGLVKQFPGRFR